MAEMMSTYRILQDVCEYLGKPSSVLLGLGALYICFYWRWVPKRPLLVTSKHFSSFLEKNCPIVKEKYYPTLWCVEGHLQTLVRPLMKSRPRVTYRNERIRTPDGGQIALDWLDNICSHQYVDSSLRPTVLILPGLTGTSNETYVLHLVQEVAFKAYSERIRTPDGGQIALDWLDNVCSHQYVDSSLRPTVLILPGLTGTSNETYVLHLVQEVAFKAYRAVVFNNRGFGGAELLTPRTFCAASTEDLETVIQHIKTQYPQAPLMAVGVSMGGMILLNYLAKKGTKSNLLAALTLSVCWNNTESTVSLEKPLNHLLFNSYLTSNLCSIINRHRKAVESKVDVDFVMKAQTIREFDERCTCVIFGYKSWQEYYHDASPYYKLSDMHVPVLCLNAADDPFAPFHTIPFDTVRAHPNIALLVTSHGGHIGFLEGMFPRHRNYMDRVLAQFITAVFEHRDELEDVCKHILR
ncbi:protein ABHD1-like [Protopterus annectens]|uniref:protein ABHD1-like n=1 Tax=Protopterus annectens TaxID=7888 RepID=UPI001CFC3A91|nr:protein ABHD1-like [Protopterus annectens]